MQGPGRPRASSASGPAPRPGWRTADCRGARPTRATTLNWWVPCPRLGVGMDAPHAHAKPWAWHPETHLFRVVGLLLAAGRGARRFLAGQVKIRVAVVPGTHGELQ